jgi:hypothetical protein
MPEPRNSEEVQRFLGAVTYLAKWIPNLSELTFPLRELTKKSATWLWEDKQKESFRLLKELLIKAPVLHYFDNNLPTKISCDASRLGLGAVLLQLENNIWYPVAYASRSLLPNEMNYSQIELELLAITFDSDRFHQYIWGSSCEIDTDHKPLVNLFKKPLVECTTRIQRLLLKI